MTRKINWVTLGFFALLLIAIAIFMGIYISNSYAENEKNNETPRYVQPINDAEINVYSQAELGAPKLGALNQSSQFFEITGYENGFYRLNYGEHLGWVNAVDFQSYTPEFHGATPLPKYMRCYGTEPFWELTLTDMTAEFSFLDAEPEFYEAEDLKTNDNGEYEFNFASGDGLRIKEQICESAMIDNVFNWSVEFDGYDGAVQGCCTIQR